MINSLFHEFGTGLVVPTLGMALQNRGSLFSFDPKHPNYLEGCKRPYQTIIPAMATHGNEMLLSFGVMGGFQQPQGQLQIVSNMIDHAMDSQEALDVPRFKIDITDTQDVLVEEDLSLISCFTSFGRFSRTSLSSSVLGFLNLSNSYELRSLKYLPEEKDIFPPT